MIWEEFVGPAYTAASKYQDDQQCINFYTEDDPTSGAKARRALYSVPGKRTVCQLDVGEVRGCWALPGYAKSIWVAGASVYFVTPGAVATKIGTLATSTGRVHIRDNNTTAEITDNVQTYNVVISSGAFSVNTDANALFAPGMVEYADGFFFFSKLNSRLFYITDVNAITFTLPFFAAKEGASDNLVGLAFYDRDLWVIGERTTELFYDAGGTTLPYARMDSAFLQIGCVAKDSIANFDQGIVWLARNERGQGMVMRTLGFTPARISNSAIENAIQSYSRIDDAIADVYQHRGHEFYVLTFPSADATWVYDTLTNDWHRRGWFDVPNDVLHRERGNCFMNFAGVIWCGDFANGQIYELDENVFVDGPTPLVRVRRAPHIQDDHVQVYLDSLQIEFQPGVGLPDGSDPQAGLRWSNDGGSTWGNWHYRSMGKLGQYKNRSIWRRLGSARDRVFEVRVSDPVACTIINATLNADSGAH